MLYFLNFEAFNKQKLESGIRLFNYFLKVKLLKNPILGKYKVRA